MADEHEQAVRQAERTAEMLRRMFDRLGNAQHPRGRVIAAYRTARRALRGKTDDVRIVTEVLADLRMALANVAAVSLAEAATQGEQQAQKMLEIYGLQPVGLGVASGVEDGQRAWLAQYDAQRAAVLGIVAAGGDEMQILGDDNRMGVLAPGPVVRSGADWIGLVAAGAIMAGIAAGVSRADAQPEFLRQAVAAIDERTTDCCLRVNGQVTTMDGRFELTGTPRYADAMRHPPFHHYCRTSVALIRRDMADDALSRDMRSAAGAELAARGPQDVRQEIDPASSTSRR